MATLMSPFSNWESVDIILEAKGTHWVRSLRNPSHPMQQLWSGLQHILDIFFRSECYWAAIKYS